MLQNKLFLILIFVLFGTLGLNVEGQVSLFPPFVYNTSSTPNVLYKGNPPHPGHNGFSFFPTAINSSTLQKYDLATPGTRTTIGSSHAYFFDGADFAPLGGSGNNWVLYTAHELSPYNFFIIDTTTGAETVLPNVTGITVSNANLTSMTWDMTTNTMFIEVTNVSVSQLYSLNLLTGAATPRGPAQSTAPGIMGIACANNGTIFAFDIVNNASYRINKTTGVPTMIGTFNFGIGGGDCAWDRISNAWYLMIYNSTTGRTELRTADTSSIPTVLVGVFGAPAVGGSAIAGFPPVGIIGQNGQSPEAYSLSQNYPNPVNPNTVISYQLPVNNFVTLKVYDILGREVETLVNKELKAGTYEVAWDGSKYSSGIYLYKLTVGDFTETKKMILAK